METPVFSDRGNYLGESYYIGDRYRENIRAVFIPIFSAYSYPSVYAAVKTLITLLIVTIYSANFGHLF